MCKYILLFLLQHFSFKLLLSLLLKLLVEQFLLLSPSFKHIIILFLQQLSLSLLFNSNLALLSRFINRLHFGWTVNTPLSQFMFCLDSALLNLIQLKLRFLVLDPFQFFAPLSSLLLSFKSDLELQSHIVLYSFKLNLLLFGLEWMLRLNRLLSSVQLLRMSPLQDLVYHLEVLVGLLVHQCFQKRRLWLLFFVLWDRFVSRLMQIVLCVLAGMLCCGEYVYRLWWSCEKLVLNKWTWCCLVISLKRVN